MEKIIHCKVIPNAKVNKVVERSIDKYEVYTKEPPENNRANNSVISQLSDYFKLERKQVVIIKGQHQTGKIIKIYLK